MNQTIYFRKDIWEKFQDHPNKSELINKLLSVYFKKHEPEDLTVATTVQSATITTPALSPKVMFPTKPVVVSSKTSTQDILSEITELEAERDDKLEYCQDETEAKRINKEYKQKIDTCWKRYAELKEKEV